MNNSMPAMEAATSSIGKTKFPESQKPKLTSFSSMFKDAISLWRQNFKKFIDIYVETLIVLTWPLAFVLLMFIGSVFVKQIPAISSSSYFLLVTVIFVIVLIPLIIYIAYYSIRANMAIYLLVRDDFTGQPKQLLADTKGLFRSYLNLSILTGLLVLLWTLLLIIPGVIFAILYSLSSYVFFSEKLTGMAAIKRSKFLVKGYFWAFLGRLSLFMLIIYSLIALIDLPFQYISNQVILDIWQIILQIISALIAPLVVIFTYRIYNELVNIKK